MSYKPEDDAMKKTHRLSFSTLALAAGAACAQNTAPETETIVITAQKRAEPLQAASLSVSAITGQALEDRGITGIQLLDQTAAGLTVGGSNPGQLTLSMRGISNLGGSSFTGPAAGIYIDEIPLSAFSVAVPQIAFWDAERIEVLRGPQGTLFGEGSMGGTIRLITNKPEATQFYGRLIGDWSKVADGGNGGTARVVLNVPLVSKELALRVSAGHEDILGWIDVPDLNKKDVNKGKQDDVRVAVRWTPNRALTVDASYGYQKLSAGEFQATSPGIFRPSDLFPAADPVARVSTNDSRVKVANLTVNYELGGMALVGAVSRFDQEINKVNDYTPLAPLFFGTSGPTTALVTLEQKSTTAELRLGSTGDRAFNWIVGGYYKKREPTQTSGFDISLPALGLVNDMAFSESAGKTTAKALFADGEYKINDQFAVQVGVREFRADYDQKLLTLTDSAIFGFVAGTVQTTTGSAKATSPKLGASFKPTKDVLLYVKASRGFRDGGANYLNPAYPVITASVKPETITAYEFGFKTQPVAGVTVNGAVYRNDWRDLQLGFVTSDGLASYIANAGKARATGAEIEVAARVTNSLRLGLNLAYVDSKIGETVLNALGGVIAQDGNRIPFSPKVQASVSASYQFAISETLSGAFSANLSHRGETYSDGQNDPALKNKAFDNLHLRLGVNADRWGAALFVANALNSDATQQVARLAAVTYKTYVVPRTIGVEFNANF
jgi:iron complex outermembrane recepter protein